MTNAEKYKEIFGIDVDPVMCPTISCKKCPAEVKDRYSEVYSSDCPYGWWNQEYKEV